LDYSESAATLFRTFRCMKVLFIGGTGNISTSVSRQAIEKGINLYHLNRGNSQVIQGVTNLTADINDIGKVRNVLMNHTWDVVVDWIAYTPEDVLRDIDLFERSARQYIFISSASAYQKPPVNHIVTESTPLRNPIWEYSRNKIACEDLLLRMYRERGFPMTIVRPSHTYSSIIPVSFGGSVGFTVIDRMQKGIPVVVHGDGTSLWTLTHASDFAKGFLGLMDNQYAIGESFHITSDEVLTWNQIYEIIARAAGGVAKIVHVPSEKISDYAEKIGYPSVRGTLLGDKSHCAIFDNSKIKRFVPGFAASIPFSEGIKQTLDWFDAEPSRRVINEETNQFLDGLIETYSK
jgi:nucleoside-diphosphate-sugar epimerase